MSWVSEPIKKIFGIEIKFRKGKVRTEVKADVVEAARAAFMAAADKKGIPPVVSIVLWDEALKGLRVTIV